jgi:hypothetical protein
MAVIPNGAKGRSAMTNGFDSIDPLDKPTHGAVRIGYAIGVIENPGQPTKKEMRQTFHAISKLKKAGVVDSFGRSLVTTPRRLIRHFGGKIEA